MGFVYAVCTSVGIEQDLGFCDPARSFPGSSQARELAALQKHGAAAVSTRVFCLIC